MKSNFFSDNYIELVRDYAKFAAEKILVRYENLINDPEIEVDKIAEFFGVDPGDFVKNIEDHRKKALECYPKSMTGGEGTIYHSEMLTHDQREMWDGYMIYRIPFLYDEYLIDYASMSQK